MSIILSLVISPGYASVPVQVAVGENGSNSFSPAQITAPIGETITFVFYTGVPPRLAC